MFLNKKVIKYVESQYVYEMFCLFPSQEYFSGFYDF
ncbi:unknown [Odoribacter laneus CAG:561]|nr:unknown [Odoribacter laneus CAG:561]